VLYGVEQERYGVAAQYPPDVLRAGRRELSVGVPARACDRGRVRVSFDAHRRPVAPHGSSVAPEFGDSATERQLPTQWYVFRVSSGGAAAGHRVRARPAGERLV
jgi:hypothetical protein